MTLGCFGGFEGFDCSILWIVMILLFFIAAIFRRQVADGLLGTDFSLIGSAVLAEVAFFLMVVITQSMKWGFLAGLIGIFVGGFVGAKFLTFEDSGEGFE